MPTKKRIKNSNDTVDEILDHLDDYTDEANRQKMTTLIHPIDKGKKYKELVKEVDLHNSIVRTNSRSNSNS